MKKIYLNVPVKTKEGYLLRLGNKKQQLFTNVLKVQAAVNETNRFLTDKMNHLNLLFATVITEYREHWYYYDTDRTTGRAQKIETNKQIIDRVKETFDLFESLVFQATTLNGYYMVWRNFEKIIHNLLFITGKLREMDEEKSYYSQVVRINLIERYIHEIHEEINNYLPIKN